VPRLCNAGIIRNNTIYETKTLWPSGDGCGGGISYIGNIGVVYGNIIYDTWDFGMAIKGSGNTVSGNKITRCGVNSWYPGIIVDCDNSKFTGNTVSHCEYGFEIFGDNNNISSNTIQYNDIGIVIRSSSGASGNVIGSNTFVGNGENTYIG